MCRLLILGATGLVGGHVLAQALDDPRVVRIIAPTRRRLAPHGKLHNPVSDLIALPADRDGWDVDGVVSALGTTRAASGSAAAYKAIDYDLPLAAARQARAHGASRFAIVTSMGADPTSRFAYLRMKGELELAIARLDWPSFTVVRPGPILGERDHPRPGERIAGAVLRVIGPILPRSIRGNQAATIARALLEAAIAGRPGTHTVGAAELV